jgi:hypothetical protein
MPTRSPSPRTTGRFRASVRTIVRFCRTDRLAGASARARAGALGLLGLLALGGCHHRETAAAPPSAPKPVLGAIDVQMARPPDGKTAQLDAGPLEQALREHLLATGLFASSGSVVARVVARIGSEVVEAGPTGEARAIVGLQLDDGRADLPDGVSFKLEGRGSERYAIPKPPRKGVAGPAPDRGAILNRLVLRIAGDLIDGYVARRQLDRGPPAAVHAALEADGGQLRDDAIRAVGDRKLRDEVPTLLKLLSDPEERTRDAALGSLIALGDRRAVSELTRTRSLRDRHEMRKMIEAIAILGGQEADQYLSFVAATHDDDEIRAEAAAAHARLQRRESDAVAPRSSE